MTVESAGAAEPEAPIAPGKGNKGGEGSSEAEKGGDRLAAWSGFSLILGLAGDVATPLGK